MAKVLNISDFIDKVETIPVIDVRSPKEFAQGHIPTAVNIPIFTNEERAVVGTLYKQKGREEAIMKGLEIVGTKLADFARTAKQLTKDKKILVHCWRGGMRSGSMAWLFDTAGMQTFTLEKGYKNYRRYVLSFFEKKFDMLIVGGMTGSGKTDILKEIIKKGQKGIDLEGLAHHKGSAFGSIGQAEQPTTEQFENDLQYLLYQILKDCPLAKIWLEDESSHIGKVYLPKPFWEQMQDSNLIYIQLPKNLRIQRLVREYTHCDRALLESAILKIRKRLGFDKAGDALKALEIGDFAKVADITLVYYDKAYTYDISRRKPSSIYYLPVSEDNPEKTAQEAIDLAKSKGILND
ncbi:tRNA 2-selenouridine(34) synthase MnmH [Thermoflexibacter ruber]|uniref:tRNA 2-selenouridine synthase n=1 Tax=Thermoflexibacter ruber TaxID=1003 RepID=A0A1I2I6C8_9BACT|nr:tRNA 2-selenouridine(34) synthase MnmH [Thermoflexibacter ruber]SFF36446.1 tRNA 2-selenouridine synthase [Thermoflexibacter ruber]